MFNNDAVKVDGHIKASEAYAFMVYGGLSLYLETGAIINSVSTLNSVDADCCRVILIGYMWRHDLLFS